MIASKGRTTKLCLKAGPTKPKTMSDTTHPPPGSSALLEQLLAQKAMLEEDIKKELFVLFPKGAICTYKTWGMKYDRYGTISSVGMSYGYPTVTVEPEHKTKKNRLRCMPARFVQVL